ncbi:MAG: hypothetical protein RMM29_08320 [Planctomycetota bacterium]|nr:hypothetical protein [Planctomycetota bacterium]MCX8039340.1 hypothetical protein [Planctomycetota bacterium]MDW8373631.1 hypothetical protein [Planctomycetota bacterium]
MIRALRLLVLGCVLATAAAGEALPGPLAEAEALIIVRDGRWLERMAMRMAAASGADPIAVRGELALRLFRCRGLEGLDLGRPALIAWRRGAAPFLAILPVRERATLLRQFGAVGSDEPPLVRTGEREGTVIFRQNQGGSEWEYRLFVARGTAFVARSVEECRRLAEGLGPGFAGEGPPLELRAQRLEALARVVPLADLSWPFQPLPTAGIAALRPLLGELAQSWRQDIAAARLLVDGDEQGLLRWELTLTARPGSELALWLQAQRPSSERLPSQLFAASSALVVGGRLTFHGQLERWLVGRGPQVRALAAAPWDQAVEDAYRTLGALAERCGALALLLERRGAAPPWRIAVVEHPRAAEFAHAWAKVLAALSGGALAVEGSGERPLFRVGAQWLAATARHVVHLEGGEPSAVPALLEELAARLEQRGRVDGEAALLSARGDLVRCLATPPAEGAAPFVASIQVAGAQQLIARGELPLIELLRAWGRGARDEREP